MESSLERCSKFLRPLTLRAQNPNDGVSPDVPFCKSHVSPRMNIPIPLLDFPHRFLLSPYPRLFFPNAYSPVPLVLLYPCAILYSLFYCLSVGLSMFSVSRNPVSCLFHFYVFSRPSVMLGSSVTVVGKSDLRTPTLYYYVTTGFGLDIVFPAIDTEKPPSHPSWNSSDKRLPNGPPHELGDT